MKKGLTELVFILDRSGSMSGLEKDTTGGFNGMIEKQKKEAGEVIVSTVLFDDDTEVLHNRVDIRSIHPMTDREYYVRGCTALLDAVGGAITHIKRVRKSLPKSERPEKTIFIITTDGMENSSRRYSYNKVKELIENRRAVNYKCDAAGTALNYRVLNETVTKMRCCASAPQMSQMMDDSDCLAEIRADHKKRKKA
jgi:uncharacterized protein YegL